MIYQDDLYGVIWELPPIAEHLMKTKEVSRLERVSLGVLPAGMNPFPLTNRFLHSMGVCYLAYLVLEQNPMFETHRNLFLAASLLHDAGSPGLSHLTEQCLIEQTGKNGEQFLEDVLNQKTSATARVLEEFHLLPKNVAAFVQGACSPLSDILNGSLDIDNLDNIARFKKAGRIKGKNYHPAAIASSFRFQNGRWTLLDTCYEEVENWLEAREAICETVYSNPHLTLVAMIDRALQIAFFEKEIEPDIFFLLDDDFTLQYLQSCNAKTAYLIAKVRSQTPSEWYPQILYSEYTGDAPRQVKLLASNWSKRKQLADLISHTFTINEEHICIYAGEGRDRRNITVPFVNTTGKITRMIPAPMPIYRFLVYASPCLSPDTINQIQRFLIEEVDKK